MKKQNILLVFFLIILSILYIVESLIFKSYTNKIIMVSIFFMLLFFFFKNRFNKFNFSYLLLLIIYFFAFTLDKSINNVPKETAYIVFHFFEIFLFPFLLFVIANISKEKKVWNKVLITICLIFIFFFIIQNILQRFFIDNNILILFILLLRLILFENKKNIFNVIFDIIMFIIGILTKTELLCLMIILFNIKNIFQYSKNKRKLIGYIIFIAFMIISLGVTIYNNLNNNTVNTNNINNYEFPSENLNEFEKIQQVFNNRSITEKLLGTTSIIEESNPIINSISLIYSYLYLGIIGFVLYLISIIYCLKKNIKRQQQKIRNNNNYYLLMFNTNFINTFCIFNFKLLLT